MLKTLKPSEIARYCDVHQRTVSRWINAGDLKGHKLTGRGNYRVQVIDFIDFLVRHKMPVPQSLSHKPQVLIIDDEANVRSVIKRVLKRSGFDVVEAAGGFEAGTLMHQRKPELITVDLSMPGLSGIEVIRFIRSCEEFKDIKVLVISGMPETQLIDAVNAGADGYICKPFSNDTLINSVNILFGKNRTLLGV
ncbi:two-component system, chemotaxis family, response regulator CheY [Pseudoalteromonas sp. BSi20311]|jgi:excisionase family DNA binding protein|nr:response regulator [Pseudoalteromonas sp. SM9913]TMP50061.1 helix-turn-helix domain-containing protein [Pseudoalteromonas sp. S1688]GAA65183.1 two-component system, chemotaxis family, response regulator CheY [Pseudoalteromonas sp. BSi20311]HCP96686.1 helix-turn-helix domain-containing protein [Pseudoalteromonas sp.]|tara:strand:+ start:3255 stop:3833 length:579 start_codon:yes stop_codon:yes gene_type:complete